MLGAPFRGRHGLPLRQHESVRRDGRPAEPGNGDLRAAGGWVVPLDAWAGAGHDLNDPNDVPQLLGQKFTRLSFLPVFRLHLAVCGGTICRGRSRIGIRRSRVSTLSRARSSRDLLPGGSGAVSAPLPLAARTGSIVTPVHFLKNDFRRRRLPAITTMRAIERAPRTNARPRCDPPRRR
jgi:hypothetical protein